MAIADTARLVASLELQDKFSRPAAGAEAALGRLTTKTGTLGRVAGETRRGLGNLAGALSSIAAIGIGAAVTGLVFSVRAASDLEESLSKVTVVFGDLSDETIAWAATAATAFGQSKQQALEAAGTFGNLFQAFGLAQQPAQEMSTTLVELAADLASFNNTSVDDALLALRSGLSGETEPLKRYGVAINDDRLRTKAFALGLIASTKDALTPAAKAQASYALILEDTALAQGDFSRTSGGLANQQRILKANLQNTAATIGTALLPKITELAVKFNDLLQENQPLITDLASKLPALFDDLIEVAQNLPWDTIGRAFELMATGSAAFLDAFTSLPPDAQAFILALGGLNKLTGGAVTGIVGALASGLIKGVLGLTAGVVHLTAGTVTGGAGAAGGAPTAAGAASRGGIGGVVAALAKVGIFTTAALIVGELLAQNVTRPLDPTRFDFNQVAGASGLFNRPEQAQELAQSLASELGIPLEDVKAGIVEAVMTEGLTFTQAVEDLRRSQDEGKLEGKIQSERQRREMGAGFAGQVAAQGRASEQRRSEAARALQAMNYVAQQQVAANSRLSGILAKPTSFTSNNNVTVNIDGRKVAGVVTKSQFFSGTVPK